MKKRETEIVWLPSSGRRVTVQGEMCIGEGEGGG